MKEKVVKLCERVDNKLRTTELARSGSSSQLTLGQIERMKAVFARGGLWKEGFHATQATYSLPAVSEKTFDDAMTLFSWLADQNKLSPEDRGLIASISLVIAYHTIHELASQSELRNLEGEFDLQ